jgi:hypothetical protein
MDPRFRWDDDTGKGITTLAPLPVTEGRSMEPCRKFEQQLPES